MGQLTRPGRRLDPQSLCSSCDFSAKSRSTSPSNSLMGFKKYEYISFEWRVPPLTRQWVEIQVHHHSVCITPDALQAHSLGSPARVMVPSWATYSKWYKASAECNILFFFLQPLRYASLFLCSLLNLKPVSCDFSNIYSPFSQYFIPIQCCFLSCTEIVTFNFYKSIHSDIF